ncbi:RNA exonuclease 1 homolog [Hypomesus transpacificus]|uniref:RNA exonuclease 1 homolog n=1 Tax=Hypomesus transpacificus TaxID=137520 RepID=UPI001F073DA6|nr:RNA exonuclease 1 homolog [Hypomesus transpacificus]
MFDSLYESSVTVAGLKRNPSTAIDVCSVRKEDRDTCLLELERINKEIETVKSEVEKEQKRLSKYQTVEVESTSIGSREVSIYKPESEGKDFNGNRQRLPVKQHSPLVKYVVDNSKPRTDLEYDPLSNFSADLRSGSSVEYKLKPSKEQKVKSRQGVKRIRETVCGAQETFPSFGLVDESEEEGVLIIDVPPSPDRKRPRAPKLQNAPAETEQEVSEGVPEGRSVPTVAGVPSPPPTASQVAMVKPQTVVSEAEEVVSIDSTGHLSSFSAYQSNKSEVNVVTVFDDLSRCLEDLRSESDRIVRYQEPLSKVVRTCSTEADRPNTEFFTQMHNYEDTPVRECQTSLMAESGLLESELSSIDAHCPPFSLSYQLPTEKQSCDLHQSYQSMAQSYWSPPQNLSQPCNQNILQQQQPMMEFASAFYPINCMEQAASTAGVTPCQPCQPLQVPSTSQPHTAVGAACPAAALCGQDVLEPGLELGGLQRLDGVKSSSEEEEELNYSDVELSDSDPMEECYRIFMEANKEEEKAPVSVPDSRVGSVDAELTVKPKALPAQRKRVAHVSKLPEPVAKSKPQVIVPLQGPSASAHAPLSKIQQLQQKASMLTAVLKGGQAFISSSSSSSTQRKVLTLLPPHTHSPSNHPTPVQNACMKVIPLGHAIKVGNNLHFILPEGSYALPSSISTTGTQIVNPAAQIVSPFVPVTGQMSSVATAVTPVFRSALPATIPITPAAPPSVSHLPVPPQPVTYIPARPISSKRKAKLRPEVNVKVPHDVRQRYVNLFVEEFLKTSGTVQEAFEKALAEEKTVYDRSVNKLKYLSVAVNALKRLKNQSTTTAKVELETRDQMPRGKIPLMVKALRGKADSQLYESLKEHLLSDESLTENNYPLQHPEQPGTAILFSDSKKGPTDPLKRICCRCGATYSVGQTGKPSRREECTYHYGKGVENKVPGGVETRYSCCEGVVGAPGCQVFKLHVHDAMNLDGFVGTGLAQEDTCPGVYAVDTEMCYTTHGLELVRVTVVNSDLKVIYDTFVKPDHEVIDYNTRFSGVGEGDVADACPSIRDVQETLLGFVSSDTILIGHSLETDLRALKLLHGTVVDTSVVFPHRLGLPHKLSLHSLTTDYLRRIIQESVGGHDTADDASACMELMLWKVREDGKAKRW